MKTKQLQLRIKSVKTW